MAYKVVTEQIPDDMLDGYRRVRFAGPGVRHALYTDEPFESRDPYTKPYPGLVSFIDMFPQPPWSTADVGYAFTSPEQRGQGHMRTLMQHVYDSYPDRPIRWGKIMDDHVQKLRDEYRQKMPDRTANDGYIAPNVATAYPLATQAFIDTIEQSAAGNSRAVDSASFNAEQVLLETYGLGKQWAYAHARAITRMYEEQGLEALEAIVSTPPEPSEEFTNQMWPDTIPWGEAEQDYYRNARIARMERLGASLEELAHETVESILGYQGKDGHKPPRADIQKYYDAAENWKEYRKALTAADSDRNVFYEDGPHKRVLDWWTENMGLNEKEISAVSLYKHVLNNRSGDFYNDPKAAFDWVARMWGGIRHFEKENPDSEMVGVNSPDVFDNVPEEATEDGKKFVGNALKKYEKQHYPMLYECIKDFLDDMLRTGPYESYKLWPRGVQWIKEMFTDWLMKENGTMNRQNQSVTGLMPRIQHIEDIVREGGQILAKLRAENKLPQGFDVNKVDFPEFEDWLMQWKKENVQGEEQGEVVYQFKDGYTIQKLTTPEQLQYEGDEMGHCVGGYSYQVGEGSTIIYSLRDAKGVPHVTIEMTALEGPPHNGYDWSDGGPEDAGYNHEPIHPDRHNPGDHMEEQYSVQDGTTYAPSGDKPFEVVQVMGNSNKTPKPEYQRKIKEFLDHLRSKGWKFKRSDEWFAPFDDPSQNEYGDGAPSTARELDDWYDDHYKTHHEAYRGIGDGDAYGLPAERAKLGVSDWEELFKDCVNSLIDEYDQSKWQGNWKDLAQAVWHAWTIDIYKDRLDQDGLKVHKKNLLDEIQKAEETLSEWSMQYHDDTMYHNPEAALDKFEELAQKAGLEEKFDERVEEALEEQYGETNSLPYGANTNMKVEIAESEFEELWQEAQDGLREDIEDETYGDAYRFCQYLYMLAEKNGMVNPQDLPDPNERHGGLPSWEDLKEMPWSWDKEPFEQNEHPMGGLNLPGTLSHWMKASTAMYHVSPVENREAILRNGLRAQPVSDRWGPAVKNQPAGLYVFDTPEAARRYRDSHGGDVWQVDGEGAQPDPGGNYVGAYVLPTNRPATLLHRAEDLNGICWQCGINPKGVSGSGHPMSICNDCLGWHPHTGNVPTEIEIHPIDHDHNVWFDTDGNQRARYRPGWAKNPTTGKMEQTGELEDTFLDKHGRQGQGWVAYNDDVPVGSLTYVDDSGWHMIGTSFVHPDFREQGIFNKLVAPLRATGRPIDAYVWENPWLKNKVRGWR